MAIIIDWRNPREEKSQPNHKRKRNINNAPTLARSFRDEGKENGLIFASLLQPLFSTSTYILFLILWLLDKGRRGEGRC
jgi:hypothetical protein